MYHWEDISRRMDRFGWADVRTSAAIGTKIRVDFIDIAFADGLNRAFIDTGTTRDAIIVNYISHYQNSLSFFQKSGRIYRMPVIQTTIRIDSFVIKMGVLRLTAA